MAEIKNLIEGLTDEILRVTEIIREYRELPGGAGNLAAHFMEVDVAAARKAQASGDVIECLAAFGKLQEYEL